MMQSDHRYSGAGLENSRPRTVTLMNGGTRYGALGSGDLCDHTETGPPVPPQASAPASTPLSPSSHFTTSSLQSSQPLIWAICFSYWDNILGPRIQHVWRSSNHLALHNTTLLHVCSRILNGEICRSLSESYVDYKFYTMPDKGILVAGFIFSARNVYGLGVHSLALVIPQNETTSYLEKYQLVYNWIVRLVGKLKVLLNKDIMENALNTFSLSLLDFMAMLSSLHIYGLPRKIELKDTTFSPSHTIETEFIERAISCHLTTMGRSVVVGKTQDRINLIVSTLALFNSPTERVCSRYVQNESPYHQDLWIQAILVSSGEAADIPAKEILCSEYPTTIINISNRRIIQSAAYDSHSARHHQTVKNELVCLHYGQEDDLVFPESSMFHVVEYPETYVHRLIKEINLLHPACGVRDAAIAQFLRFLQRKALALIKYIETETAEDGSMARVNVKRLKQTLGFTTEGDYRIVLATAEKLKPGIYCYIHGHKRHDIELVVAD